MTSNELIISCQNLQKSFRLGFSRNKSREALRGVSLEVAKGSAVGFVGPNGAGKTTTIKIITGLLFADSGTVSLFGETPDRASVRRRLGFLPENPAFHDHLTGLEVLRFASELLQLPAKESNQRIAETLELVKLTHAADLQVRRYSKGMVQRLGIAQALLQDPELLILDEPMSGLDPVGRRDVKDLLKTLRQQGKTLFFSTHIIPDVEEICDRVLIVVGGRVVRNGTVADLLGDQGGELEIVASHVGQALAAEGATQPSGLIAFRAADHESARSTIERIWSSGGQVLSVSMRRYRLEDVFMEEIKRGPTDARSEGAR